MVGSALSMLACLSVQADLRRTSGLLNGAAALLVELARATAAAMLAAEGNLVPLMANTATVLELQGNGECKICTVTHGVRIVSSHPARHSCGKCEGA